MKGLVGLAIVLLFAVIANVNAQGGRRLGRQGRCGPMCRMHCPNGFVIDRWGCPICRCRPFRPPIMPPMSLRCPRGSTPMGGRRCSPMFGRNDCGRGGFCHSTRGGTRGGSRWGICCRGRWISPRPWQSPRPRPFPRPFLGYSRRDED